MKRSRFVYDRSLTDDLADVFAGVRSETWCEPQRIILDRVIASFAEFAFEHDEHFDVERFHTRARFFTDRLPVAAPPQETTVSDPNPRRTAT